MKKILSLLLVMVIAFSLAACGGASSLDANNEAMQAKMDQADALVAQIGTWYADKGYLEGETAEQMQTVLDTLQGSLDSVKAEFQAIMDAGGFTDEDVVAFEPVVDNSIGAFQKVVDEQAAYDESIASGTGISVLIEKYNLLSDLVMETSVVAMENGWDASEAFISELSAATAFLEATKVDLDNPSTIDEALMAELNTLFDEMIVLWTDYSIQVSQPYTAS